MTDRPLARPGAVLPTTDVAQSAQLPPCIECGGEIGFAANPGNAIEWWRCTKCGKFYPVRHALPGAPAFPKNAVCAVCGKPAAAVSITVRQPIEATFHFCSIEHASTALKG